MITRKDIAMKVGVSVSVVSRALNNSGYVDENKKAMIIAVANELGYHPNPVAMSLQQKRTKQILFYSKDLNNFFNIELYEGMLDEAEKAGYVVLLNGRFNFGLIPSLMIDGIVLPNTLVSFKYLEGIGKNYHLPIITAGYGEHFPYSRAIPVVETDMYDGMQKALEYLHLRGHRKIALVTPYEFTSNQSRIVAWKDYMMPELQSNLERYYFGINKTDMDDDNRVMKFLEEKSMDNLNIWESYYEKGILAAEIFDERNINVSEVMCFNDEMAIGFCHRLNELGYCIPDDISIMGIDGIPEGQRLVPRLTTLEIQARKMGATCFRELLSIINGEKEHCIRRISTRIIEGDTVKLIKNKRTKGGNANESIRN